MTDSTEIHDPRPSPGETVGVFYKVGRVAEVEVIDPAQVEPELRARGELALGAGWPVWVVSPNWSSPKCFELSEVTDPPSYDPGPDER